MTDPTADTGTRTPSRARQWTAPLLLVLAVLAVAVVVLLARGGGATPVASDGPEVQAAEQSRRREPAQVVDGR